jgi:predicted small lipoprotein YifL
MRVCQCIGLISAALLLSACGNKGNLTLEPGARKIATKGSANLTVNQGGKALIIEQGKTAETGVHGWISIQSMSARNLSSTSGHTLFINKPSSEN